MQFSSSVVSNSATPWTAVHQASTSIINSRSLLRLKSIELVVPSNHLILCHCLLLPPSIFPSIRVFSNESVLHIRWLKYWSFNFSISPSNEYSGLILKKSYMVQNSLELKLPSRPSPLFCAKQELSHLKKKMAIKVDYAQHPAGPASGLSPKFLAPAI